MDTIAPTDQKAVAGSDYVTVSNGVAFMSDQQTSTTINITILPVSHHHTDNHLLHALSQLLTTLSDSLITLPLITLSHITLFTHYTLVLTIGQHS